MWVRGEGCDLWYSTRKRHALRLRIFSSLENHKLHKSAHPSIQGKSDITTPLVLVKKSTKPWVNCLENHSLSGNYDGKDEPKNPAQCEPLAERLWFFILTDFVPIETHMSSACDFFFAQTPMPVLDRKFSKVKPAWFFCRLCSKINHWMFWNQLWTDSMDRNLMFPRIRHVNEKHVETSLH